MSNILLLITTLSLVLCGSAIAYEPAGPPPPGPPEGLPLGPQEGAPPAGPQGEVPQDPLAGSPPGPPGEAPQDAPAGPLPDQLGPLEGGSIDGLPPNPQEPPQDGPPQGPAEPQVDGPPSGSPEAPNDGPLPGLTESANDGPPQVPLEPIRNEVPAALPSGPAEAGPVEQGPPEIQQAPPPQAGSLNDDLLLNNIAGNKILSQPRAAGGQESLFYGEILRDLHPRFKSPGELASCTLELRKFAYEVITKPNRDPKSYCWSEGQYLFGFPELCEIWIRGGLLKVNNPYFVSELLLRTIKFLTNLMTHEISIAPGQNPFAQGLQGPKYNSVGEIPVPYSVG